MQPALDPKLAIYNLGGAGGPANNVQPLHWLPALPGQLLGDNVKYYQIGTSLPYSHKTAKFSAFPLTTALKVRVGVSHKTVMESWIRTEVHF